ncbi:MAG: hypothetical protein COA84_09750 [Robiginitomaculum sp.]|nr:MAG: hypothetical protein COA84_09750 [Robiginitomaculum sp.]
MIIKPPKLCLNRRGLLQGAASIMGLSASGANLAFAAGPENRKLVVIILRGAMDGLNVVVPHYENRYYAKRPSIAIMPPGEPGGAIPLTDGFGLHPALPTLAGMFKKGQAVFMPAASAPYNERSHFDGQDVLENGTESPLGTLDGWLNRALGALNLSPGAVGIGQTVPLVLKGASNISTWAASKIPEADPETVEETLDLYAFDPVLHNALQGAVDVGSLIGDLNELGSGYEQLARAAGKLLSADGGPGAAALSLNGWDTHADETSILAANLGNLDVALFGLREELGSQWANTAVMIVTEFGRTLSENGTKGTDHGVGGVSFLLGGAVKGGTMVGDWPGLGPTNLFEGRDVYPANDLRSLFKGVLRDHWGVDLSALDTSVFPGSAGIDIKNNLIY